MRDAGKRSGPYVIINQGDAVGGLASIDDEIITVFRVKGAGRAEPDPRDFEGRSWTGEAWVARWLPALTPGIREHGYLGFKNEVQWNETFDKEMIDACTRRGIKCTYGNFSVGSIRDDQIASVVCLATYGASRGHLLSFNTYWDDTNPGLFWYFLPVVERLPNVPWILGEVGFFPNDARYPGPVALRALLAEHAKIRHAGYQGGALWCENGAGGGWGHSDIGDDWRVVLTPSPQPTPP